MSFSLPSLRLRSALRESVQCLGLALRDSLRPTIVVRSCMLCLLVFAGVTWLYFAHFDSLVLLSGLLSAYIVTGGSFFAAATAMFAGTSSTAGMASLASVVFIYPLFLGVAVYIVALATIMLVLLFPLLVLLGIHVILHAARGALVHGQARKRYPHLRQPGPTIEDQRLGEAKRSWKTTAVIVIGLCIPGINFLVLLGLLAYLNIRSLVPWALYDVANGAEMHQLIAQQRMSMLLFSLMMLPIACIPVLNLLLPGMLGAGTAHLACRGLERVRAATGSTAARQVSLAPS